MTASKPPSSKGRRLIKVNAISQAKLIKLLIAGDMTCAELSESTGLHYVTVLQYCRELHLAGAAYISRWERDRRGSPQVKVYKIGERPDAKRVSMTALQKTQRYRAKKKGIQQARAFATPAIALSINKEQA